MTDRLYLRGGYVWEFDAVVAATGDAEVALDRTAFFPGGGGQPADTGWLRWGTAERTVVGSRTDGQVVWHRLEGLPPAIGERVRGALDWERRYAIMRHHSALHVLVGAVYRLFGALVTGGAIHPDRARMDFSLEDLNPQRVAAIEEEANRVIAADLPIRVRFVSREEFERSDLLRLARNRIPQGLDPVRVVEIEGYDAQADGGTHVARTGEIGALRVVRTDNKGRVNRRIEIALAP
ncbi:MAG: alanyl-tRNA editing protein [Armatimonadota bacterium]|nr:alanyl-tRNA editing protein [Armatimonadota bacterium]MDR5697222.1 alanyl-tRNA editing protein [Armatimonadota bacterium]